MYAFSVTHVETGEAGSVVCHPHFDQSGAWVVVMWEDDTFTCEPVNNLMAVTYPKQDQTKKGDSNKFTLHEFNKGSNDEPKSTA